MMLWILIAVLTAGAALAILVPLARTRQSDTDRSKAADEAVYREQLDAISSELERGLIDEAAAEAARTETARRLLAAHERAETKTQITPGTARIRIVQGLAILALPVLALGLYLGIGSPDMPDQPLAARMSAPADTQSVEVLIARVEGHLADNPEDGQGWAVIAPVYLSVGQPAQSAAAYANALRLIGPKQEWFTDMGEALTIANQGIIPANAREAFEQAVQMDATAVKPRFFLALALSQEGKTAAAIAAWRELLAGADDTAAWVPAARGELAKLTGRDTDLPGPAAADVEAADQMDAQDRQAMIEGMVAGLADRLQSEGGTADEWNRLIRAYMVLGEKDKAEKALEDAEAAFSDNPDDLARIKDVAEQIGLSGS